MKVTERIRGKGGGDGLINEEKMEGKIRQIGNGGFTK